eukprot:CAMPEP_0172448900 /NCGR_PEP_ID=MMETSP1065-20121228/7794_1 /TAXON_ID=265537 /ORGANISM="Amphiprora paludosa, Strain CCMP125" /LENGTH=298 /DNA_ID=CAMNT_0013200493 /DNA_START=1053 /DNA_END=1945 /DNA_ORIENTATION=+
MPTGASAWATSEAAADDYTPIPVVDLLNEAIHSPPRGYKSNKEIEVQGNNTLLQRGAQDLKSVEANDQKSEEIGSPPLLTSNSNVEIKEEGGTPKQEIELPILEQKGGVLEEESRSSSSCSSHEKVQIQRAQFHGGKSDRPRFSDSTREDRLPKKKRSLSLARIASSGNLDAAASKIKRRSSFRDHTVSMKKEETKRCDGSHGMNHDHIKVSEKLELESRVAVENDKCVPKKESKCVSRPTKSVAARKTGRYSVNSKGRRGRKMGSVSNRHGSFTHDPSGPTKEVLENQKLLIALLRA